MSTHEFWRNTNIQTRKESCDKARQHIKSRDITLLTKVCIVKIVIFPVIMYWYESWTRKKAECRRTDAFKLWCWKRLLRTPWTARRSNWSILKEFNHEYSLEEHMLKLQYFGHLMQRAAAAKSLRRVQLCAKSWLTGKDLDAGKDGRQMEKRVAENEMVK